MTSVTLWIVIAIVVVVLAVGAAAAVWARRRRSARLREEFGPEYDRTVQDASDRSAAEADLRRRRDRHDRLELRALDGHERDAFQSRWEQVQRAFVDDPGSAVGQADDLVVDVMSARGYPIDDVDRRVEDLSVAHPVVTQHYREARDISRAHREGRADTEDLRRAVTSYRSLVDALLDDTDAPRGDRGHRVDDRLDHRDGDERRRETRT